MSQEVDLTLHIRYQRDEWNGRQQATPFSLSPEAYVKLIDKLNISEQEIRQVYLPIASRFVELYRHLQQAPRTANIPLIIGVAGSVAGGKSTIAQIFHTLFEDSLGDGSVAVVSTDSFLYPMKTMTEKNMLHRKGFPESYDMEGFVRLLYECKSGFSNFQVPIYSHDTYDILPDETLTFTRPKMVIVEGLNVLQVVPVQLDLLKRTSWIAADFIDISIYVDAEEENQIIWYLERVKRLWTEARANPYSYYHQFTSLSEEELLNRAMNVWNEINHVNLHNYILPSRERADVILHKNGDHSVSDIYVQRKLRI
ncbi:type I pantothenate kinase [Thermoactinomyces sp. DSM 45892]|uniref:type I pantothenate kinase n=1 Tax=Thermoactinomyces sp. DSM 45892 TaxID=1882753 RepID=UPI00089B601C|nr:type I pantothenate kinase [Thermoactinomyces sp. DSM 45892]SDY97886.1 pantothenate kinase [Thermoactinomyces sp. DSM 45892]